MRYKLSVFLLTLAALLAPAAPLSACPSCRDAVPSTTDAEEDEQLRESRAYNHSIYLMAGMPYLLLGLVGYGIYRGVCKPRDAITHPQSPPCPLPAESAVFPPSPSGIR